MPLKQTRSKLVCVLSDERGITRQAAAARKQGARLIELRADLTGTPLPETAALLKEIKKASRLPVILTIRSKKEGGKFSGSESQRLELFNSLIPSADLVDIELSSRILKDVLKTARRRGKKVIISFHDFKGTPSASRLKNTLKSASAKKPDFVKIAACINQPDDFARLADLLHFKHKSGPSVCIIPMVRKRAYRAFRLLASALGSGLSYACLEGTVAPGQIPLREHAEFLQNML